ncbi:MAG TPA: glycosyltransferase family 2 protein, partial [Pseudobdellovibrionaceae bacterium]|nr:glycosyltransferase family 2 protein [Pseudobdellovibrionaceae bacterium]
ARIYFAGGEPNFEGASETLGKLRQRSAVKFNCTLADCRAESGAEWLAIIADDEVLFPHAFAEFYRQWHLESGWPGKNCVGTDALLISTRRGSAVTNHLLRGQLSPLEVSCRPWLISGLQFFRFEEAWRAWRSRESTATSLTEFWPNKLGLWLALARGPQASIPAVLSACHADDASLFRKSVSEAVHSTVSEHFKTFGWTAEPRKFGFAPAAKASTSHVSIVIPSKESFEVIERCLRTLFEVTAFAAGFDVYISDNGSTDPRVLELYRQYEAKYPGRFQAEIVAAPFNFNAQVNRGVRRTQGELVLLLNNDTEIVHPNWLHELVVLASLPSAGAVGSKLLYPDGLIQHAGVESAGEDIARHTAHRWKADSDFAESIALAPRECFGVTAACLLLKRQVFEVVGPFDEIHVPNGFGDVDWCLRLRSRGFEIYYQPESVLIHHESLTRGASVESYERLVILNRWHQMLVKDPFSNPTSNRDGWHMPGDHRAFPAVDWNFVIQAQTEFPEA